MLKLTKTQQSFGEVTAVKNKNGKDGHIREFLSKLSRGLMLPVAMMPVAGMLLGIGSAFTSKFAAGNGWYVFGEVLSYPGSIVFACLPMLFAVAIAITFTKDAGAAGLCSLLGWIIFCAFQHALIVPIQNSGTTVAYNFLFYHYDMTNFDQARLFTSIFRTDGNVGILALSTSVFGGMTIGAITALLFNKFKNVQLPNWIGFFSGTKFVPVVAFPAMLALALIFGMIWPLIGAGLFQAGGYLSSTPAGLNVFAIQMLGRSLLPFGLHFVVNALVSYSSLGGSFNLDTTAKVLYEGHIYYLTSFGDSGTWLNTGLFNGYTGTVIDGQVGINNQLLKYCIGHNVTLYNLDGTIFKEKIALNYDMMFKGTWDGSKYAFVPTQYSGSSSCVYMFGLPAAALAMLHCVPKGEQRKQAGSILISAGAVSALTGVSEPIEFTFLFVAPLLFWGFNCVMNALMCMIGAILMLYTNYGPFVYGSCIIDILSYSLVPEITTGGGVHIWVALLIGIPFAPIYYLVFKWAILKFNYATPGRNGNEIKLFTKKDYLAKKENKTTDNLDTRVNDIIEGLGGKDNIVDVGACTTRLRVQIKDSKKVSETKLKQTGALGFVRPSPISVQVIYGLQADAIKEKVNDHLKEDEK